MANFFSDNKDLQFHLQHPLMRKIVELKERGFAEKDLYDYAPQDFEDAMDSYRRVLEIAGEVCGEVIAPNAEGVDHEVYKFDVLLTTYEITIADMEELMPVVVAVSSHA